MFSIQKLLVSKSPVLLIYLDQKSKAENIFKLTYKKIKKCKLLLADFRSKSYKRIKCYLLEKAKL